MNPNASRPRSPGGTTRARRRSPYHRGGSERSPLATYGTGASTTRYTCGAFCSLQASPGCQAYYQQRRALGDGHNQALRALANRLVAFLHGCLHKRRLYNEETAWGGLGTEESELAA